VIFALAVPLLVALFVRTAPLLEGGDRLRHQCITEDGYLMLTIARNIALGHGFSIADGTIATNGTQPLTTLLFAGCIWLAGGDRIAGLYPVVAAQILWSIAGAIALYFCARRLLYRGPNANIVALIAAALWFLSPTSLYQMQNGLETGFYALLILLSVAAYDLFRPQLLTANSWGRCIVLGVMLGLTFLTRNDACFLIAVMLLFHLIALTRRGMLPRGFAQCLLIGLTSIAVASPWLWFNVSQFGHIMPVSGRAQIHGVEFAYNLLPSFVSIFENATIFPRIPGSLESQPWVAFACLATLLVIAAILWRVRNWLRASFSPGVAILALFVGCLYVYYALFFGMPGFLGRYFFPVTILGVLILAAAVGSDTADRGRSLIDDRQSKIDNLPIFRGAFLIVLAFAFLLTIAFNVRIYRNGRTHLHAQVVEWVDKNVPDDVWVGATQTGTLGYYHDRTINLDGKVNPIAFEYRQQGRIAEYARQSNVKYIVDWVGHAAWAKLPQFAPYYELLVEDHDHNLAVLRLRENALATDLQEDHLAAVREWIDDILANGYPSGEFIPLAHYVTPDLLYAWTGRQPGMREFLENYEPWFRQNCGGMSPPEIAFVSSAGLRVLPLLRPLLDGDCVATNIMYYHPHSSRLDFNQWPLHRLATFLVEATLLGKTNFTWRLIPDFDSEMSNYDIEWVMRRDAAAYASWIDRCYDAQANTIRCPASELPVASWYSDQRQPQYFPSPIASVFVGAAAADHQTVPRP